MNYKVFLFKAFLALLGLAWMAGVVWLVSEL